MKFLLISYSEMDGVGQHVINLNLNLKKVGHQSKVILLHKYKTSYEDIIEIKRSLFANPSILIRARQTNKILVYYIYWFFYT